MYDVIIIGGGITGTCIARELSKYELHILLVEKNPEICAETSRINSGIIHGGYDAKEGTLKARLNVRGNKLVRELAPVLHLHFKQCGSLVTAFSQEEMQMIYTLYERGKTNGAEDLALWDKKTVLKAEPNLSAKAEGALYCGSAGIICPFDMTCAFAENAVKNGAALKKNCEVTGIEKTADGFAVQTVCGTFKTAYLVNAAGLYADTVAAMLGETDYTVRPRKGEYRILDKSYAGIVKHIIFQTPTKMGKGILVSPTSHGNIIIGPSAENIKDKEDTAVTAAGLKSIDTLCKKSVPSIDLRKTIRVFAGNRPCPSTGEFMIYPSKKNRGFIHAGGIDSPGLSSAPAVGEYIAEILKEEGCKMKPKADFNPERKPIPRFAELPYADQAALIKENPLYGHVICRCETVTEAEIIAALKGPAGACTVDGIKRRVRPGSGRCQGGFCAIRVMEIISRELHIPVEKVLKDHIGSEIVTGRLK
jgi:Predicted dehydrogenase